MLPYLRQTYFITAFLVILIQIQESALASNADRAGLGTIQEAQGKAEMAAKQYEALVKKSLAQAKSLAVANGSSRCPINQSCFGKKAKTLAPESLKQDSSADLTMDGAPRPIVFVSSSMPKSALQELGLEAKKHKARLVIRGMVNNSMKETGNLAKEINHPLDIDPKLFKKYGVTQVPTFAIPYENEDGQEESGKQRIGWRIIRGNIKLTYALETGAGEKNNDKDPRSSEKSNVMFPEEEPRS